MYLSRKKAKSCSCFPHKLNIRKGNSKEENEIFDWMKTLFPIKSRLLR